MSLQSITDEATGVVTGYAAGIGLNAQPLQPGCPAANASATHAARRRLDGTGTSNSTGTITDVAVTGPAAAIAAFAAPAGGDVTVSFNASIAALSAAGAIDPAAIRVSVRSASSSPFTTASSPSNPPPSTLALGLGLGLGLGIVAAVVGVALVWATRRGSGTRRGSPMKSVGDGAAIASAAAAGHASSGASTTGDAPAMLMIVSNPMGSSLRHAGGS